MKSNKGVKSSSALGLAMFAAASALSCFGCTSPLAPLAAPERDLRAPTAPIHFVSRAGSGVSKSESAIEDRLGDVKVRLEALAGGVMDFWKAHGLDTQHGGVHGFHDRKGVPKADAEKGLVQQTRHLWSFSTWYARREKTPEIKAAADSVYKFLIEHFKDKDGEFFYRVSRDGKKAVDPKKQLYAESFAIFALATYSQVFDVPEAGQFAMACFKSIDARTHDAEHLGYDQTNDPGWLAVGAQKDTNTHIHLLEAFTALYRLSKDELVKARLEELVRVIATRVVQPGNYAHKEFFKDWRVHEKAVVSYGHDLETAWLLIDALDALGKPNEPSVQKVALALGKHSADLGYDAAKGGYYEEGVPGGQPTKLEKIWWIQAEALPGLWWLYRLSGEATFLDRLEGTLGWIETSQRDVEFGEWYWGINPDGTMGSRGDHKGEEWKAQYHGLRALIFTSDWIDGALSRAPGGPVPPDTAATEPSAGP